MNPWPYIIIFTAGILAGLVCHPLARMIHSEGIDRFLDALGRIVGAPFSQIGNYLRRRIDLNRVGTNLPEDIDKHVDPREQLLSDSAQTVRNILLSLASAIQRTGQATSDSSQILDEVRSAMDQMALPADLQEVHSQLMNEVNRMISTNSTLRRELMQSEEILASQRQQIESLKTAVRIDGLTQLANRAYFDEKLSEMVRLRQRYDDPFSLLMLDVDNFKEINDTHGHQGGDRILKGVAFKIRSILRGSDFVARFGGDEFAVILIKATTQPASDVAWKLCEGIRNARFILDGHEVTTSLSIGVAEACSGESSEAILKRADAALYRVKQSGRNSVSIADPDHEPRNN